MNGPWREVVITGVGIVTVGLIGRSPALGAWLARQHDGPAPPDARLPGASLEGLIDPTEARRLSRACQLAVGAARLAVADSGVDPARGLALVVGSELGDFASTLAFADGYLARGPAGLSPLLFPSTVMNTMAATAAIAVGARELALTINASTVAGELAVARAAAAVASGRVDAALAGGVDELNPFVAETLVGLGDAGRRAEGATFLVLEAGPVARARGASIRGRITGFAWSSVAAGPWQVGRAVESRAITAALARAADEAPGFVYRSASGDAARDDWEARVLSAALRPPPPPATALAGQLGQHAGLGALHVAAAAWSARSGLLPAGDGGAPQRVTGPGLVHGLARGGIHVALVVAGAPVQSADAIDAARAEPARA